MLERNSINNSKEDLPLSTDLLTKFFEQINKKLDDNNEKLDDIKEELSSVKNAATLTNLKVDTKLDTHESRITVLETDKKDREAKTKTLKTDFMEKFMNSVPSTAGVLATIIVVVALVSALGLPVANIFKGLFSILTGV
jgi:predicted  nucleic acid-binding Zn-ribbon protein